MRETAVAAAPPQRSVVKENDDASETKEPGAKKLVQARLPFKRLDPLTRHNGPGTPNTKRAKLSPSNLSKEMLPKAKLVSAYERDNAVSSSSEYAERKDSVVYDRTGGNLASPCGPLDKFIITTQERQISTTNVIDLTEESNDGLPEKTAMAMAAPEALDQGKGGDVMQAQALLMPIADIKSEPQTEPSTSLVLKPKVTGVDVNSSPLDDSAPITKSDSSKLKQEVESHEENCAVAEDLDTSPEPMDVSENNFESAQDSKVLESSNIADASKCVENCTTKEDEEEDISKGDDDDEDMSLEEAEQPRIKNVAQPEPLELMVPSQCFMTPQQKKPLSPATSRNHCPDTPASQSPSLSSLNTSTITSSEESFSLDSTSTPCKNRSSTPCLLKLGSVKRKSGAHKQKMVGLDQKQRHRKEEKLEKQQQREEARLAREESRRKLKEEREQKEQEKAEKLKLKKEKMREKQEAIELKQEEKRKKEEEKSKLEEEKRMKKEKSKEAFASFFTKGKTPQAPKTLTGTCGPFAAFEIKDNMRVAPVRRVEVLYISLVDEAIESQMTRSLYLDELKQRKPKTSKRTFPNTNSICMAQPERQVTAPQPHYYCFRSEIEVIEVMANRVSVEDRKKFGRMKLLQFQENNRPAYCGTWSKRSKHIKPCTPFAKDDKLLDYEVDSDDEWEEEEPGESISHSEGEQDDEEEDDDEDDDGFFVPHGHLSDGEGVSDGEEKLSAEGKKLRERLKAKEWDDLTRTRRYQRLEPVVMMGCLWEGDGADSAALQKLLPYKGQRLYFGAEEEDEKENAKKTKQLWNIQILGDLLPLVHGNVYGSKFIIDEFQAWWLQRKASTQKETPSVVKNQDMALPSKMRLKRLIKESAVYKKRNDLKRVCWYVHPEVLLKFGLQDLPVPSRWNYVTVPPVRERDVEVGQAVPTQLSGMPAARDGQKKMTTPSPINTRKITAFIQKQEPSKVMSEGRLDQALSAGDNCMILGEKPTLPCNTSPEVVPQVPAESLH